MMTNRQRGMTSLACIGFFMSVHVFNTLLHALCTLADTASLAFERPSHIGSQQFCLWLLLMCTLITQLVCSQMHFVLSSDAHCTQCRCLCLHVHKLSIHAPQMNDACGVYFPYPSLPILMLLTFSLRV